MKAIIITAAAILSAVALTVHAAGQKVAMPNPDFTKGDTIPAGAKHDWNLGATGLRGWIYTNKFVSYDARQVSITQVEKGSPADGEIKVGDVILGVAGKPFYHDPRTEFGKALTAAEAGDGITAMSSCCFPNITSPPVTTRSCRA